MYGLDNASGVNVMPKLAPASSATPLWFTEGGAGLAASYPGQDWFNMVQAELLGILTAAGVKPEKGKLTQLADAVKKIVNGAGFQPSGDYLNVGDYGIGGELPPQVTDANDAKKGGIYSPAGEAGVNFYDPYAPMFVMNRNGLYIRQFQITPEGKIAARDIKGKWKVYSDDDELKTRFLGINSTAASAKQLSTKSTIAGQDFYGKGETITITPQGIGALKPGDYGIGTAYPPPETDANNLVINGIYAGAGAGGKNYFDPYAPIFVMTRDNKYICHMQVNLQGRIGTRYGNGAWNTYPTLDEFNAKKSLGEGQRWQDVKGSRSSGVSYTNTTGRTIALSVSTAGAIASSSVQIFVDDVLCSRNEVGGGEGTNFTRHSIGYAIVPPGSSYKVVASSIGLWAELR